MPKQAKLAADSALVRTRRAYFDCRFGQLHVRTAFPSTGGFDEGVTLFCLHHGDQSSRSFARFLPEIAEDRSVYAPDLPGCGESDAPPEFSRGASAEAVADLAADLRLRQIDVVGLISGAAVGLELAVARPDLVRRLVLVGLPAIDRLPVVNHECLVLKISTSASEDSQPWARRTLARASYADVTEYSSDLFEAAPKALAKQIGAFLARA